MMAEKIDLSQLLDAREVPTPPAAALLVLEIRNDPEAGMSDLVGAVQQDPGLAAKIMSTANSPVYRRGDEVTSVERAVAILGFRSVTTIALAFSVASTMPQNGVVGGIPMSAFWTRSIVTAATARLASVELNPKLGEEAFFVGLVAGLGRVVMGLVAPEMYEPLADEFAGWPTFDAEREVFDFGSLVATAGLLRQWGMPELFAVAAERIESVEPAGDGSSDENDLARIVRLSMAITDFYVTEGDGAALRDLIAHAHEYEMSPEAVETLLDDVFESAKQLAEQFDMDADVARYAEIVAEARTQLVDITLQTDEAWHVERYRREELEKAREELEDARVELERANRDLSEQARKDPLTGLFNRRAFNELFSQHLKLRIRDSGAMAKPMGAIMIDIDHFKAVNDEHGHDSGDAVLKNMADILRMTTRAEETIARYGGEEFILFAPMATPEELALAAERIRSTIEHVDFELPSGESIKLTASFGAATLFRPTSEDDGVQLVKAADEALYEAKENGRNRVVLSTSDLG